MVAVRIAEDDRRRADNRKLRVQRRRLTAETSADRRRPRLPPSLPTGRSNARRKLPVLLGFGRLERAARARQPAPALFGHVETVPPRPGRELRPVADAEVGAELLGVVLDGVGAQVQAAADLVVGEPEGDELEQAQLRLVPRPARAEDVLQEHPLAVPELEVQDGVAVRDAAERAADLLRPRPQVEQARHAGRRERAQIPGSDRVRAADERDDRKLRPLRAQLLAEADCRVRVERDVDDDRRGIRHLVRILAHRPAPNGDHAEGEAEALEERADSRPARGEQETEVGADGGRIHWRGGLAAPAHLDRTTFSSARGIARKRGKERAPRKALSQRGGTLRSVALDRKTEERIEQPVSAEAERETRLTPAQAVEAMRIRIPVRGNRKLRTLVERVNADRQLKAWWHVANINAVVRLQINDHSWVHIQIVTNIALKLLRQLTKHGVEPSMVTDYGMTQEDSEVVVTLGALLHDVGMSVHRDGHEDFSLFLGERKARELLAGIYELPELAVVVSEVLHAITSHRAHGKPLTLEAGVLRVADALDMAKGRSRIPFERGSVSIHALSAAAIDSVKISDGDARPIMIEILMTNSSGIFQVDGLLKEKLRGSGLEPYVEVVAHIDTEAEKSLVPLYRLET